PSGNRLANMIGSADAKQKSIQTPNKCPFNPYFCYIDINKKARHITLKVFVTVVSDLKTGLFKVPHRLEKLQQLI
ncbi:MAG: hypothetical protein QXO23_07090, partial [Candidatus Methanomethyliaceae archaeon]